MKFNLTTAGTHYSHADAFKLEELGFRFESDIKFYEDIKEFDTCYKIYSPPEIEINSLEELMNFIKKWGKCVVTNSTIIIYDDYIE